MAFYDFLVSKALKNQYGYSAKIKTQSLQTIELTNNSTQTSLWKIKNELIVFENNNRGYRLAVLMER
ncbi:hypothetical protein KVC57_00720 [Helicobacter pylori]|nr:hypothetical protein KVC57_00720 [Helicobacter pylori]